MPLNRIRPAVFVTVLLSVLAALPASGEVLRRELGLELTPLPAEAMSGPVWDFSGCSTIDARPKACARFAKSVYYEELDGRCRAYFVRNDTVFYRGYNIGRHERMLVDGLLPVAHLSSCAGAVSGGGFTAAGLLYDIATAESGFCRGGVLADGMLVFHGDTIRGVRLVREDLEVRKCVGGDSTGVVERGSVFRWIRRGEVLPLAVQTVRSGEEGDGLVSSRLYATDFTEIGPLTPEEGTIVPGEHMRVISGAGVSVGADEIEVSFPAPASAFFIDIHLLDLAGNLYRSVRHELAPDVVNRVCLPRAGCPRGRYVVAISICDNPSLGFKLFADL